ncbi:MAG TPA: FAD:protein FMN transferase, partial [Pirellulaceae bacterium]
LVNSGPDPRSTLAAIEALELVASLEQQLSVFLPSSEISAINQGAYERDMCVEGRLFDLLRRAREIHDATGGAFDITSAPLWRVWGFARRRARVPSKHEIQVAMDSVGMAGLQFDLEQRTVRFTHPRLEINLGAIGKGYACDRAADHLLDAGLRDFLIHGGGSSVVARGSASDSPRGGWRIDVPHPWLAGNTVARIYLHDQALATSGAAEQSFMHAGRRLGHILDPRTGWPADAALSVTVVAPWGSDADALATALCVMGLGKAREFCRSRPEIAAIILSFAPQPENLAVEFLNAEALEYEANAEATASSGDGATLHCGAASSQNQTGERGE